MSSSAAQSFLVSMGSVLPSTASRAFSVPEAPGIRLRVLDSIHEDGAKLVELSPDSALAIRAHQPGLRLVPVVYYRPAVAPRFTVRLGPRSAAKPTVKIKLEVVSRKDGGPIAGAQVVAFTDFANLIGAQGTTNSKGQVNLSLGAMTKKVARLYVYPPEKGFWGALRRNLTVSSGMRISLRPVDLPYTDALRALCGHSPENAGAGVKVAVIDTGVDKAHPDLEVEGGTNTVVGEDPGDFDHNGDGHGTHVAGIVAARGKPPVGLKGLAPAVALRSYRVFGENSDQASNYAIMKAIDRAVADGCDLINMSLGGGETDDATRAAIEDARSQGSLVIAAAGNDYRQPVSFPASHSLAIAVSAMGRKGTFPGDSTQTGDVASPYGRDRRNFLAAFSNIGPEIDLTGPGVGILSTVPGGYAAMDGTSMACPAVTGLAARLLWTRADILGMQRNQARSDAMGQVLLQAAVPLGFGPDYEGQGLPR
jgi:subtilisin